MNEIVTYPSVAAGYAGLLEWATQRPNVTVETAPASRPLTFPEKLNLFWISQNYHDLSDKFLGPLDVAEFIHTSTSQRTRATCGAAVHTSTSRQRWRCL